MIQKKIIFLISLLIICIITTWSSPVLLFSYSFLNEEKIKNDLQHIQQLEYINSNHKNIIDSLQAALYFISEKKLSHDKIKEYQEIIDNFSYMTLQLREEHDNMNDNYSKKNYKNLSIHELKQKLPRINNQLMNLTEQLKKEEDQIHSIHESLKLLPQQKNVIKNRLNNLSKRKQIFFSNLNTSVEYAKFTAFQAEQEANRFKIVELELAQLSASNRKELSKLQIALLKKKYDYTNHKLQILQNQLFLLRCQAINQAIACSEKIVLEKNNTLPNFIHNLLKTNHDLSLIITQETHYINNLHSKKKEIETNILQARQTFSDLIEQSQWVDKSPALGETLRAQVSNLPKMPKFHQLDHDMAQVRVKRLQYENHMKKLPSLLSHGKQDDGSALTLFQKNVLEKQLNIQHKLIVLLINNYDTQILELTKLKLSYEQLQDALQEIQQATHRYLFWVADVHPITTSYPLEIYQDILRLFTDKMFHHQIKSTLYIFYNKPKITILTIFCAIILLGLHFSMKHHYYEFLERSYKYIGKVNQDNFLITFHNIWSSIFIAMPIPILWMIIGYHLTHIWQYPIIISIGDGVKATTFMLWAFIVSSYFASPKGLFIAHFGWSKKRIQQFFSKNYTWSGIIITFLTMALTIFNSYNNREFSNTLGRACFILICIYLVVITNKLKHSRFPLYLNKYDSSNNIINHSIWNIMICAPVIAAIACALGYLFAAQVLLTRLEISLFIWALLLIIYHVICRWMLIQRRRIAFKRAQKKRALELILRTHNQPNTIQQSHLTKQSFSNERNQKVLDLNTISSQSLQLIRSVITLIAILLMTVIWSELKSAFSFLENITLWDVTSTIKGVDNIQPITLNTFLIVIVVIIITTITMHNLPAFLELTLLQHLHLTPGTGYAITTLTKYISMLLGGLIGFSLIGIEWVKIQWLIAALGVGLGFGLQEIFANFISGLMILFEKPIRIGDTVTIRNFTGNITRINTRATIITDWDHKEIIVPNKEFITKQFINWSLSDTITRVIVRIPTPLQIDIKKMTHILIEIIKNSPLALDKPAPEVYLINLQYGLPIFEIRIYTADIKSRIPLCHQINTSIIEYYKNNGFKLPYLPLCCYNESFPNNSIFYTSNVKYY